MSQIQTAFFVYAGDIFRAPFSLFPTADAAKFGEGPIYGTILTGSNGTRVKTRNKEYSVASLWWKPYS